MKNKRTPAADRETPGSLFDVVSRQAIQEAAVWYANLKAEDANEKLHQQWQAWMAASPLHQQAWDRLQQINSRLSGIPSSVARPVLSRPASRRAVLGSAVFLLLGSGAVMMAAQQPRWRYWSADLRSGIGETVHHVLPDGSDIYLNTSSAVSIAFDGQKRQLILHAGEILIQTKADTHLPSRPFLVQTRDGLIEALGTRFMVRLDHNYTQVQVLQHAVAIGPNAADNDMTVIGQGQGVQFDAYGAGQPYPVQDDAQAWLQGRISVINMPLKDFVQELSRYRAGYISCDAEVADIRVSGVFPVNNTDEALRMLAEGFPLHIQSVSRYWVRISSRSRARQ